MERRDVSWTVASSEPLCDLRSMNVKRITRLLQLLQILQSGSGQNANDLARTCKVSRRTAFRDIESLRAAGVPVSYDSGRDRYSIPSTHFLPPVNFSATEALSLAALAMELGDSDRLPFYEPARSAALKLESGMPPYLREQFQVMRQAIKIHLGPVSPLKGKRKVYQSLIDARAELCVVRIQYESRAKALSITTNFRPYALLFHRHSWYAIGRSSFHSAVRTFNLNRIAAVERLNKRFSIPSNFNLEGHLRNAWALVPEAEEDHQVVVRFTSLVAENVAEVAWHKTQQIDVQTDGSMLFRVQVSGLNEILWWILAFGDQAEVIQPERLRELVAQRARNMVSLYDAPDRLTHQ